MPRYYFDVTNGHTQFTDDEGEELQGDRQARDCARSVLTETLKRPLGDSDTDAAVTIRDASGPRFLAKLSIRLE
jgi:uncharacterized protein DUF6894